MEGNKSGISPKKEEAPASHHPPPPVIAATTSDPVTAPAPAVVAGAGSSSSGMKKKRGRPRKFGPDGVAMSPAWQTKTDKVTPVEIMKNKQKLAYESPAEKMVCLVSANLTPHVITVNPGEDIIMKIMSISKQGGRSVCVLSANGSIANVSLCQPLSSGGTLTYEGWFEIISLSGSYMAIEMGGGKTSITGRLSVSLAGRDGRVFGGGLAGLLVAATPVQVVVGSFVPVQQYQQEQRGRSQRPESLSDLKQETRNVAFGGVNPIITTEKDEDKVVTVQSKANSLGGNKISFSANAALSFSS